MIIMHGLNTYPTWHKYDKDADVRTYSATCSCRPAGPTCRMSYFLQRFSLHFSVFSYSTRTFRITHCELNTIISV